jgi:hypothetical protein
MYSSLVEHLHRNKDKLNTMSLSKMPSAMPFLDEFPMYIHWESFASNPHPTAVKWMDAKAKEIYQEKSFFYRMEDTYNCPFWNAVSANPEAIHTLLSYPENMSLHHVARNPRCMYPPLFRLWGHRAREPDFDWEAFCHKVQPTGGDGDEGDGGQRRLWTFLEEHKDCIDWSNLSRNPHTIPFLLERHPEKIHWMMLADNPHDRALDLLEQQPPGEIWFRQLCANTNPRAMALLQRYHPDPFAPIWNWWALSANPSDAAVALVLQYTDYIQWHKLSSNPHPEALALLDAHPERISWGFLSSNPSEALWSCAAGEAMYVFK